MANAAFNKLKSMLGTNYIGKKVEIMKVLDSIRERKDDENNGSDPS